MHLSATLDYELVNETVGSSEYLCSAGGKFRSYSTEFLVCVRNRMNRYDVVAASGTDRTIWGASFFKRDQIRTPTCFGLWPSSGSLHQSLDKVICRLKFGKKKTTSLYVMHGKLPPRTYPGCSVPEPYRSHDWALVPAKPGLQD